MLYELLDALWEVRQNVYEIFPELDFIPLFEMEYEIEKRVVEAVKYFNFPTARSDLIEIYRDAAKVITADVIDWKLKQFHPVCACHSTPSESSSPANHDAAPR